MTKFSMFYGAFPQVVHVAALADTGSVPHAKEFYLDMQTRRRRVSTCSYLLSLHSHSWSWPSGCLRQRAMATLGPGGHGQRLALSSGQYRIKVHCPIRTRLDGPAASPPPLPVWGCP